MKNTKALLFFLSFFSSSLYSFSFPLSDILYGEDDRFEVSGLEFGSEAQILSKSVGLLLERSKLQKAACSRFHYLETEKFGTFNKLCKTERFYHQDTAGFCTGFLVSDDVILTAGHCFGSKNECGELAFLFSYDEPVNIFSSKKGRKILSEDLFFCKEILFPLATNEEEGTIADLAIVKLDRRVEGRNPLLFGEEPLKGDEALFVLGHPFGLPLKVAYGGRVLENYKKSIFTASLDTYSGNSGSPVINEETGFVEGMLIRGAEDFILKGNCYESSHCKEGFCFGEEVLRSQVIKSLLNSIL